jgi:hypothetical protein
MGVGRGCAQVGLESQEGEEQARSKEEMERPVYGLLFLKQPREHFVPSRQSQKTGDLIRLNWDDALKDSSVIAKSMWGRVV